MANLAVEVAGVAFKNPIIPASGVFGYGREYEKLFPLSKLGPPPALQPKALPVSLVRAIRRLVLLKHPAVC